MISLQISDTIIVYHCSKGLLPESSARVTTCEECRHEINEKKYKKMRR